MPFSKGLGLDDDDAAWYALLSESLVRRVEGLPAWPDTYTQQVFVGQHGEVALADAFKFFKLVRANSRRFGDSTHLLDFGMGWGRIIRCFYRALPTANLHGVDIDSKILEIARATGVAGDIKLIEANGVLPFADNCLDIAYAFSVFSHLSEEWARHWLDELIRVLKPGGKLIFTSTTDKFLRWCVACRLKPESERTPFEAQFSEIFPEHSDAVEAYGRGAYVFSPGGGEADVLTKNNYGWTALPEAWLKNFLGRRAKRITFTDDGSFEQGVFIVEKARRPIFGIF